MLMGPSAALNKFIKMYKIYHYYIYAHFVNAQQCNTQLNTLLQFRQVDHKNCRYIKLQYILNNNVFRVQISHKECSVLIRNVYTLKICLIVRPNNTSLLINEKSFTLFLGMSAEDMTYTFRILYYNINYVPIYYIKRCVNIVYFKHNITL